MRFKPAAQLINALPFAQSTLLLGPPGIGKTALAREIGNKIAAEIGGICVEGEDFDTVYAAMQKKPKAEQQTIVIVEVRDLCSHLPEDLLGLPFREGGVTVYAPPVWLARLGKPGVHGVLVLDDIAAASPAIQTAAFKLVLERKTGDCKLAEKVKIVATANRKEDKSGATMLPAALRNRCAILTLEPDVDGWCEWAATHGIPGEVPAFIRFKNAYLSMLPRDAHDLGSFATPRTWEMVGRALKAAIDQDCVQDMARGLVGEGVGDEFAAFCKIRQEIPDPRAILMNPKKALPTPPGPKDASRVIALVTAVAEVAAPLSQEKGKIDVGDGTSMAAKDIPAILFTALEHITQNGREYCTTGILTYAQNQGHVGNLIATARNGRNDPRFKTLLGHLKGSLLPGQTF